MSVPPPHPRDPVIVHALLAAAFAALCAVRLTIPSAPNFDEVHYLPAVRELLALGTATNLEHPPFAKQVLALGVLVFGDNPLGWRIMPLLFGALALYAAMRGVWQATRSRFASVVAGLLLATGFPLLVLSRIAMLDIFMIAFVMVALWLCARAVRAPELARSKLALAGVALGLAMASKWNAVPLAMLPGLAFLVLRLREARGGFLTARRGAPIPGMTLLEAGLWLGLVPLATYALTYWPFLLYENVPGDPEGIVALHRQMLELQMQVKAAHPYQSGWWQWVPNSRAIWFLYEPIDGAQRGVVLLGHPLTSLLALGALVWAARAFWLRHEIAAGAVVVLYAVSLASWIVAPKPVQFYYHYALAHCFALVALALLLDRLWQRGERALVIAILAATIGLFAWFYPILTAAPLDSETAFLAWAWLEGWR